MARTRAWILAITAVCLLGGAGLVWIGMVSSDRDMTHAGVDVTDAPPTGRVSHGTDGPPSGPRPSRTQPVTSGTSEPPDADSQAGFIKRVEDDREVLYTGKASAGLFKTATVREPFPLDLRICGSDVSECTVREPLGTRKAGDPEAVALGGGVVLPPNEQSGANQPLGDVKVRGRVRATVSSGPGLTVTPQSDPVQLIAAPADVGHWRWLVEGAGPGIFVLRISITVLRGSTDEPLVTPQDFPVSIDVRDTVRSWVARKADSLKGFVVALGSFITGIASTVVAYLVYRHQRQGTPASSAALPAGAPPVPLRKPDVGGGKAPAKLNVLLREPAPNARHQEVAKRNKRERQRRRRS